MADLERPSAKVPDDEKRLVLGGHPPEGAREHRFLWSIGHFTLVW